MDTINGKKKIGFVGLGYVGLPLALIFVKNGFNVIGIDNDPDKIKKLNNAVSYLNVLTNDEIKTAQKSGRFTVSTDFDLVSTVDVIIICVPTPLNGKGEPDLNLLLSAVKEVSLRIKKGQLFIIESSTYPGTTQDVVQPILLQNKFKIGEDIFLAYSPERVDPGNQDYSIEEVPKIISGVTKSCETAISNLYSQVFHELVIVSNPKVAEFTKMLENSFRLINISFINELAILCDKLKIDLWEAIHAASSKPFGFTPFYPGPGIGGHCIPVDPLYLLWKIKEYGFDNEFISLASNVNNHIQEYVVNQIKQLVKEKKNNGENIKILVCGVTYKKNINDIRESAAISIIKSLQKEQYEIIYFDPYIPKLLIDNVTLTSTSITEELLVNIDCVVILTDHHNIPIQKILDYAPLVYDTRNLTSGLVGKAKVFRLGGGDQ